MSAALSGAALIVSVLALAVALRTAGIVRRLGEEVEQVLKEGG